MHSRSSQHPHGGEAAPEAGDALQDQESKLRGKLREDKGLHRAYATIRRNQARDFHVASSVGKANDP
jgi:hypothetical protein